MVQLPDVTTGLCADGSQPQGQAPPQLVCSDGTAPDVTTGLCADGSQPQGQAPPQLVCSDGTAPDVTTGLCADGSQPQGQAPPQLVCSDGTAPDVTTGLCADGSQPQGQAPPQLVCSDGTAPDVTTGLCADGLQPQSAPIGQTDSSTNVTGFASSPTTQDTQEVERNLVPREEPIQPMAGGDTCDPNAQTIKKLSSGPLVTRLQNLLAERGFNPGSADGIFGDNTDSAVKQFQQANSLSVDGVVGPNTWKALCASSPNPLPIPPIPPVPPNPLPSTECDPTAQTIKKLSSGPLVTRLQNLLAERGFNSGVADGIFGDNTEAAVKQFQQANNLIADGIVGPNTWQALCASAPSPIPVEEVCGDGIDNNSDGLVDENCAPIPVCDFSNADNNSNLAITAEGEPSKCAFPQDGSFDPSCPPSNIQHPVRSFNKGPWKFDFGIVDGEGLVLTNIKAGSQSILDKFSVTHFRLDKPIPQLLGPATIIRFCEALDQVPQGREPFLAGVDLTKKIGTNIISWSFKKSVISADKKIQGSLTINYEIVVRFTTTRCEIVGKTISLLQQSSPANDCFRLIPKVTYTYQPASDILANKLGKLTVFYRMEFGASETGGRGLAEFGGDTPRFLPPELFESRSSAVRGGTAGSIDNIHDMHAKQGLFVPGCRPSVFDCFHMHWRWNPNFADVRVDPETDRSVDPNLRLLPILYQDKLSISA